MTTTTDRPSPSTVRTLLTLSLPAVVTGVISAVVLFALEELAALLEHVVWSDLPAALAVDASNGWWIFGVLTLTGLAVGLVVWLVPGHGGQDSATVELVAPAPTLRAVPSIALVAVLGLAGGVSLGPEAPIIAINTGIVAAVCHRFWPRVSTRFIVIITAAATVGALFATPVAAALVFTGVVGGMLRTGALWDKLFLPLVAAGAGAVTMSFFANPHFAVDVPAYIVLSPWDLLSTTIIAAVAAVAGLATAAVLPWLHRAFRMLRHPLIYITAGGVLLGVLGAIGGPLTLFKGLSQMNTLVTNRDQYAPGTLILIVVIKVLALLVSAAAGFRGGRIFPSVFLGVAIGVLANALVPAVPASVAIAGGVLGMVLAISRDGWIAIFIAVAVTGGITILPVLCIAILPTWLLVSRGPEMIVHVPPDPPAPSETDPARPT